GRGGDCIVRNLIGAVEYVLLPRPQIPRVSSAAGYLTGSFAHHDDCGASIGIGLDSIFTGLRDGECEIGSVDFERVVGRLISKMDFDGPLSKLELNGAIIQREKRDAGFAGKTNRGAADVDLAARIFVRPQIVAGSKRAIRIGLHPILISGNLIRDGTLDEIQTRYASGWIILRGGQAGKSSEGQSDEEGQ